MKKQIFTLAFLIATMAINAQDIKLPAPQKTGGMPLMEALNNRKTQRSFSNKELSQQQISNLLWAASGVNREDGRMTAPTASNNQQVEIFVATTNGVYQYLPKTHELKQVIAGDQRTLFSRQDAHQKAPVLLLFVANYEKMPRYDDAAKTKYGYTDVGNVSQNVYLFCASEGLATVVMGMFDGAVLAKTLGLSDTQKTILTQAVGFPQ
ncbi:MAG: nitroreductase family protein [Bacteroidales bacterium]|jgi:SagB-type dehydrogenase family enzyme|nr:nitroreductase family protein [Bacteroidales bacterium]